MVAPTKTKEPPRLEIVAQILARDCVGVQCIGVAGVQPRDVQRIAQEFLDRRHERAILDDVTPRPRMSVIDFIWSAVLICFVFSASVMFLILTSLAIRAALLD